MTCEQMDAMIAGAEPLSDAARAHLDGCGRCRRLTALLAEPLAVPEHAAPRVVDRIAADLKPVAPLPSTAALAVRIFAAVWVMPLLAVLAMGTEAARRMNGVQLALMALAFGGAIAILCLSLARQMTPAGERTWRGIALGVAGIAAVVLAAVSAFPWSGPVLPGIGCTGAALMIAAPAALLSLLILRRGAVLSWDLSGAIAGLAAGLAGAAAVQARCTVLHAEHIVIWHAGAVVLAGLAGFLLGRVTRGRVNSK